MGKYNVMIIDDNLLEVLALKKLLSNYCINIKTVNYFLSIEEGILAIQKDRPDIVFLDVMFKESIIFDYLDLFDFEGISVIFVSSEGDFAMDAFQNYAVDFILKPFRVDNVIIAINKAIKNIAIEKVETKTVTADFDFLAISSLDKIDFVEMKDILFCMADGKYTTIFLFNGKKIVSTKNLGEYEKLLNNSFFYRIHHGYIINVRHLISIIKKDGVYCELVNRITIPISKRRQESFNKFIKLKS